MNGNEAGMAKCLAGELRRATSTEEAQRSLRTWQEFAESTSGVDWPTVREYAAGLAARDRHPFARGGADG